MDYNLTGSKNLSGEVALPPDKSISHRAALFASISDKTSRIENYSAAADPQSTLQCLKQLGVRLQKDGQTITIQGVGRNGFSAPGTPLDCGNSGTTMRLLTGMVAGAGVEAELVGDESLSSRTMKRIIDPLRTMGCTIEARSDEFAPLAIKPHSGINAIRYPLPIASAQLKSCVLLTGLFGEKPTEVIEQVPSRDHTERLLDLSSEPYGQGKIIRSSVDDEIPPQNYRVPGDFSAAAFWLVGGTLGKESDILMKKVGINPSRTGALIILKQMGAEIEISNRAEEGKEPVADLRVQSTELQGIDLDPALIPNCIDELPILMVAMCFANGTSTIRGAEELRHKETDRLSAMYEILSAAGADTELHNDGITIHGSPGFVPGGAEFNTYHDHRMAMAAAILATRSKEASVIKDSDCTAISYPDFWTHLESLTA